MRPALLRPPLLVSGRTSDFSGVERVISTKSATLAPRRPGVVGLYLRIPTISPQSAYRAGSADGSAEDVDRALAEGHDRTLGVLALAQSELRPPRLALAVDGVDRGDLDGEDLLDRDLDLRLVGPRVNDEGVLPLIEQPVALLRDDRRDQDVARVLGDGAHLSSSSISDSEATAFAERPVTGPARNASSAPCVKITSSEISTSYVFSWSATSRCPRSTLRSDFQVT